MSQIKVLVIDDEEVVGEVLTRMLIHLGYDARWLYNDGNHPLEEDQVIEALNGVDLLLTDGVMTGLDGAAMIQIALDHGFSIDRVMVVTAILKGSLPTRLAQLGQVKILQKPFKMDELETAVSILCGAMLPQA